MELKRVVVTGLGAVTPVGNSPEETWENLLAGKSGAAPITHFDTTNFKTKFACEVKDLNINEWIDRKEARKLDRYTQLAMIAAMQGVKDANIDLETEDLNNVGVVSVVSRLSRMKYRISLLTRRTVLSSTHSSSLR